MATSEESAKMSEAYRKQVEQILSSSSKEAQDSVKVTSQAEVVENEIDTIKSFNYLFQILTTIRVVLIISLFLSLFESTKELLPIPMTQLNILLVCTVNLICIAADAYRSSSLKLQEFSQKFVLHNRFHVVIKCLVFMMMLGLNQQVLVFNFYISWLEGYYLLRAMGANPYLQTKYLDPVREYAIPICLSITSQYFDTLPETQQTRMWTVWMIDTQASLELVVLMALFLGLFFPFRQPLLTAVYTQLLYTRQKKDPLLKMAVRRILARIGLDHIAKEESPYENK